MVDAIEKQRSKTIIYAPLESSRSFLASASSVPHFIQFSAHLPSSPLDYLGPRRRTSGRSRDPPRGCARWRFGARIIQRQLSQSGMVVVPGRPSPVSRATIGVVVEVVTGVLVRRDKLERQLQAIRRYIRLGKFVYHPRVQ
jgi:hypothetical protein